MSRRSIQRDLHKLSALFPLVAHDTTRPYGWSWAEDAVPLDIPAMDPPTALTFELVGAHLERLLPRSTFAALTPHVRRAREVLDALPGNPLAGWSHRVRVLPAGLPISPAVVSREVVEAVYEALLDDRRLEVTYRRRGSASVSTYPVRPLGLVLRGVHAYLVCTARDYDEPVQLLLNRIESATLMEVTPPTDFDLDAYIASGAFGFRLGDAIRLRVLIDIEAAPRLTEVMLGPDHTVSTHDEDRMLLEVTIADTLELRCWLLGFGGRAQVLDPPHLRAAIEAELRDALLEYGAGE